MESKIKIYAITEKDRSSRRRKIKRTEGITVTIRSHIIRAAMAAVTVFLLILTLGCASDTARESGSRIICGALTEPHSLCPLLGTDSASTEVQSLLYNALVRVDASKEITGDLAESWQITDGGTCYTFRLKDGILWHDGKPFGADDVVFTFRLAKDPSSGYIDARELKNVKSVTAEGQTVTFRLAEADSAFLARLTTVMILPRHVWESIKNLREEAPHVKIVGTGPYRLTEWKKAQYLRFAANESYHLGAPHIRTLFYKIVPDSNVLAMQLRRGEIDVCYLDSTAKQLLARDASVRVSEGAGQAYTYIALNHKRAPFDDRRVRLAMLTAFRRDAVIDRLLGGSAYLAVADLAPSSAGYHSGLQPIAYDADEAAHLLEEAGYTLGEDGIREKDGKKLTLRLLVSNKNKRLGDAALAFRQNMREVGIDVEVVPMDFVTMRTKHLLAGDYDACLISQRLPIDPLIRAEVWTTSGAGNHMGYESARIDALYEQAKRADGKERDAIFRLVQEELLRDMPQLFLWYPSVMIGMRQGIEGIDAEHLGGKDNLFYNAHTWTKVR